MENLDNLIMRRDEIYFELIEADSDTYFDLQEELKDIEQEIEFLTGE